MSLLILPVKSGEASLEAFHDSPFLDLIKLLFKERPARRYEILRLVFARNLELLCTAWLIGRLFSLPVKLFLMQQLLTAGVPSRAEGEALGAPWSDSPPEQSTASMPPQPEKPQTLPNGDAPSPLPAPSASPSPT